MVEAFGACLVGADVVGGPAHAELLAARRELADDIGEVAVVWIAASLARRIATVSFAMRSQSMKKLFGPRVEEDEPGMVGRPARSEVHFGVERETEAVGGEDVQAAVLHERRRIGDGVEKALHARSDALLRGSAARAQLRFGCAGEVEQVSALGLVELEPARERFEYPFGDAAQVAALHLGVVVDGSRDQR
jgi:hypothetical protein